MPHVRPTLRRQRRTVSALAAVLTLADVTAVHASAVPATETITATASPAAEVNHTFVIQALPSARTTELDRTQNSLSNTELRSTGFYLPAATALNVVVHDGSLLPTLVVGAPDADARKEFKAPREYQLRVGRNTVIDAGGGVVYLKLIGSTGQAKVSLGDQARPMPYFVLGRTTEAEFQQQLDERTTPYVELVAPHTMITVERESALKFRTENHATLLSTYEDIVRIEDALSGFDGSSSLHARQAHPYHFVGYPAAITGVGAYATHGHMSFPPPIQDRMLTVEGLRTRGWGIYHELGHQHQQITYKPSSLTEVTVNLYSLAVNAEFATKYGQVPRLHAPDAKTGLTPWQSAPGKLRQPGVNYGTTFDPYEKLVMFEQLRMAFGPDFWPGLHKLVRVERPAAGSYTDEALRLRNFVVLTSRTAGYDLRDFFQAWGFPVDAEAISQLDALGLTPPPVDPTTLRQTPPS
ncbi:enhancin-like peptidase M60 family [Kribbella amoyensis]|uniref:Enhancin-like peptidase M60 family n=1 Tax=Kribbella amoyensis TaxID=996641 RepID=A0A561BVH1_9ACTN|nr:M60 family metallopeptidase [Kribbella amoyensis]TWD82896.1 enhancin-like peptidase M60 family [Kribbella amoyensis]